MQIIRHARLRAIVTATLLLTGAMAPAFTTPAAAHGFTVGKLTLQHPWTRATAGKVGAGYTIITNNGTTADQLVSATTPAADKVEFHTMSMDGGVMKMRPLPDGIAIPAGGTAKLAPGGSHLMLIGLKAPLVEGTLVPLTLNFAKAGPVKVELKVEAAGAAEPAHAVHAK
jgi:hypothetical protein